jgi:hypothetical protein
MSFLQLKEASLKQACTPPLGISQVFIAICSIADQSEKNEMGAASSRCWGEERCTHGFEGAI